MTIFTGYEMVLKCLLLMLAQASVNESRWGAEEDDQ